MTNNQAQIADLIAQLVQLVATPSDPPPPTVPEPREVPDRRRVLLTVEEAADRLRIGRTVAYRLVKSGELESVLIGRLRRVPADAITAYAQRLVKDQAGR